MLECPNCNQPLESGAIACPYCRTELKAYGHPGIPLYRADAAEFLCTTCIYHQDDSCTFPQRPYAKTCTLYHDRAEPLFVETKNTYNRGNILARLIARWQFGPAAHGQVSVAIALLGIVLISLLLVLAGR